MKKTLKILTLLFISLSLFACDKPTDTPAESEPSQTQPQENPPKNPILLDDGTIVISKIVDDVLLKYNEWGTGVYSFYQSTDFDITELFENDLPKAGDTVKYTWKGKSNSDIKNLNMLIADIERKENGSTVWTHLISEAKKATPVKTNIKAGEEFEISGSVTLDKDVVNSINILLCCGADSTDGPVHLYSTETENTEAYDTYMANEGNAIMNAGIEVLEKGKIRFNKSTKIVSFTKLPKIKLASGTVIDGNAENGEQDLLNNGYFEPHFWSDDFTEDVFAAIGIDEKNKNMKGNWYEGALRDHFADYYIASKFIKNVKGEPIYIECNYFAMKDSSAAATDMEYHFPVMPFEVEQVE